MEEFDFLRRAICFKDNEGTSATECKVDVLEIGDSNDERIIISSRKNEITKSEESEIEERREDIVMLCPAYNHSSLCSHALAAREHKGKLHCLLQWHQKNDVHLNVTIMSTYGLDIRNAGKKPQQRKRGKKPKALFTRTRFHL